MPLLEQHEVQLWPPETDGPVDRSKPTHQALIMLLGVQHPGTGAGALPRRQATLRLPTRRCRTPPQCRTRSLGSPTSTTRTRPGHGRPRTADVRPEARRQQPCQHRSRPERRRRRLPSTVDPGRNHHRTGEKWTLRTVAAILANPRYTGRQVWNRQGTDVGTIDGPGARGTIRWNHTKDWVISAPTRSTSCAIMRTAYRS
ncbi:recombinase family protein [Micromonospora carbonacea]|uniref:recombinase family protein n=1 Tax=Micromonospora carbonacea TaxID=47853 RepID=UPI003D7253A6